MSGHREPSPVEQYFLFCDEKRAEVKATIVEGQSVTAKLTELWHDLPAPDKAKVSVVRGGVFPRPCPTLDPLVVRRRGREA